MLLDAMNPQTLTVLFADLAGSTHLYQTIGDVEAHQLVTDSLQRMQVIVERHQGSLLKTVGDAVLASFEEANSAYLASIDIQREHQALSLSVRVGFHHGPVIPDGGDVYGNAVNLAARVAAFAEANEICTTEETVAQLPMRNRSSASFLASVDFKGISTAMPVYRIQWVENDQSETTIITTIKRTDRYQNNLVLDLVVGEKSIRIDTENPVLTFGRAANNDVTIDIESASRNHAKIEFVRGRFLIQDSSTNGTYIIRSGLSPEFIRRESAS
ncbi:MAG: adenylate cyclase, partial [Granulosicoccus sp.]